MLILLLLRMLEKLFIDDDTYSVVIAVLGAEESIFTIFPFCFKDIVFYSPLKTPSNVEHPSIVILKFSSKKKK